MSSLPEILDRYPSSQGPMRHVEKLELRFANHVERTYTRVLNAGFGAAIVIPMQDEDTVLLVSEYAAGLHHYELGPPKGRLEQGEDATVGANRELKEEIGYGARKLTLLGRLALEPAYMSHVAQVVLAEDLYAEKLPGDEPEPLEIVPWKLSQIETLLGREDVTSGRALAALFMARAYLQKRDQPDG